jgi:DNA-binding MarR family transcriptional regulator
MMADAAEVAVDDEVMAVSNERHLAAWRAFLNAHAAVIARIEGELAARELIPLAWYDVLVALWEAPQHRLRLSELAAAVVLSRSGLSRLIDRLEQAGLVRREPSPEDRRGAFAVLTPAGRAAQLRAWPVYAQGIQTYFAQELTEAEVDRLADCLGRVDAAARRGLPIKRLG